MFKQRDWACPECEHVFGALVDVPSKEKVPLHSEQECPECGFEGLCELRLSLPSPYMGEIVLNPNINGGNFDTMGKKRAPALPEYAPIVEHGEKIQSFLNSPGEVTYRDDNGKKVKTHISKAPLRVLHEEVKRNVPNAPKMEDAGEHLESPEYKEIRGARKRAIARNKKKAKRAAALARGENINFRKDRCEGDPKF